MLRLKIGYRKYFFELKVGDVKVLPCNEYVYYAAVRRTSSNRYEYVVGRRYNYSIGVVKSQKALLERLSNYYSDD